jgi:hypothetical protein
VPLPGGGAIAKRADSVHDENICQVETWTDSTHWHHFDERAGTVSLGEKEIKFWDEDNIILSEKYPAYPDFWPNPSSSINFDTSQYTSVKKYFHNSTTTCTSFEVGQFASYDRIYHGRGPATTASSTHGVDHTIRPTRRSTFSKDRRSVVFSQGGWRTTLLTAVSASGSSHSFSCQIRDRE